MEQCNIHTNEIQRLKEEVDKIHDQMFKLNTLDKKVDKILYYLESDSATNQKGLVEKTENNSFEIYKLKEKFGIYEAKASVWGAVGGGIVALAAYLINVLK